MKNLWIILGILGGIFIIVLALFLWQMKDIDFSPIPKQIGNTNANLNQISDENLNIANLNDEVEDVGDLNFYTQELGRSDADIQSKRVYTFYAPVDIVYELQGIDASSSDLLFKKDGQLIFQLHNFDYLKTDDQIDEFWPTADDYSFIGGHTNILELEDDDYEDEMYIFADTLQIDGKAVF